MDYSVNDIGTTAYAKGKDTSRFLLIFIHRNKYKMNIKLLCEIQNFKPLQKEI